MATTVLGLKTFAASDPVDYNEINDNYNKIDNGVKTAFQGRAAHNLLDNSWFVNSVNQRGKTSYSSPGYTIDRWDIARWSSDGSDTINLSVETNGIRLSGGTDSTSKPNSCYIRQKLDASKMLGKTYTIAVNVTSLSGDGNGLLYAGYDSTYFISVRLKTGINIVTFTMPSSASTFFITIGNYASSGGAGAINVLMEWAALYEGSYTADTLPAYQPKGYAAELAECERYHVPIGSAVWMTGFFKVGEGLVVEIPAARNMRINNPTVVLNNPKAYTGTGWNDLTYRSFSISRHSAKIVFDFSDPSAAQASYGSAFIVIGIEAISADL